MKYQVKNGHVVIVDEDGEKPIANFVPTIERETRLIDGINEETRLLISGYQMKKPEIPGEEYIRIDLPTIEVNANDFPGFSWVLRAWGSRCVIFPGGSNKDELRTYMQLVSEPKREEIYGCLGWTATGKPKFLHAGGAITASGPTKNVKVELPPELRRFNLDQVEPGCDPREAWQTVMKTLQLAPPEVTWPLMASVIAPTLGPVDYAFHLAGRSGTYKSEITSIFQSFFGAQLDARHLPGAWSSTANALEALAFFAQNVPMVIDDFVPQGTSYQVKVLQGNADRLIRGQGNQAGRARLSDTANYKTAFYPRGQIISSGEDTPEGHSVRARMLIAEMTPGDANLDILTECQRKRAQLPIITRMFLAWLARQGYAPTYDGGLQIVNPELKDRVNELRQSVLGLGHSRTPQMIARMIVSIDVFFQFATMEGFISQSEADQKVEEATAILAAQAARQTQYLEAADPTQVFIAAIRAALSGQKCHMRSMSGGVPSQPDKLGWTVIQTDGSEMARYKSHGPTVGWIDWNEDAIYLEADLSYTVAKKENTELALTKPTLWKRLKDAGLLLRTDAARSRNTVRVTAESQTRNVLALAASVMFDEGGQDDEDAQEEEE